MATVLIDDPEGNIWQSKPVLSQLSRGAIVQLFLAVEDKPNKLQEHFDRVGHVLTSDLLTH